MAKQALPTPQQLRQLLRYEPETGKLFWIAQTDAWYFYDSERRTARHAMAQWNSKYAGKEAFTSTNASGHKRGRLAGRGLLAHRVIWAIYHGEWPAECVDHINMDPADNRICNLRAATKRQNGCNRKPLRGASSQYLGVLWCKPSKKWAARISVNNKPLHLGVFSREIDAARAYDAAALKLHGEFARPNFSAQ